MDRERVLAGQTVLIAAGRITALGPNDRIPVPAGAVRIDGRGKYLMPGLTDMHTHFHYYTPKKYDEVLPLLFTQLANGVTAMRHLSRISAANLQMVRQSKAVAERVIPRLYFPGTLKEFLRPELTPDSIAAEYKAAGFDFLFEGYRSGDDSLVPDSLVAAGRRRGIPHSSHTHTETLDRVVALGAAGSAVEHAYWAPFFRVYGQKPANHTVASPAKLQAMVARVRRGGAWITPTMACYENFETAEELTTRRELVKRLQVAGVRLLLGAEGGYVHDELAGLVRAGLTPYQALATGTRNPAEYFGLLDSTGTVAVGKWADLVLLRGNPLADIRHTREPEGVMLAGRWFDRAELDRRLLAAPRAWFRWVEGSGYKVHHTIEDPLAMFAALTDSLTSAKSLGREGASRVKQLLMSQAAALEAMRAVLEAQGRPGIQTGQAENLDAMVRAWLREQARQGYRVAVRGVAPVP